MKKAYLIQVKHEGNYITQLIVAVRRNEAINYFLTITELLGKVNTHDIKVLFVWSKDNIKAILEELA
jgi:hypothetical protein